ncbi:MAG: GGDEF domain-containing protein [Spirochaetes bacterium]|nr:GGDEF domain-containing protein [Spirochaetota bacterium]
MANFNTKLYREIEKDVIFKKYLLEEIIQKRKIIPYFQPIIDFQTGDIHGYEILSRAESPFENPAFMFEKARIWGLSWELEYTCRTIALDAISGLPDEFRDKKFFLNVSPNIFSDYRFSSDKTLDSMKNSGLNPGNIVIEVTETTSVDNYEKFEQIIQYYVSQGFNIALDDFGAGHSGLLTLVATSPKYMKIDNGLISGIHNSPYKQNLVKSIIGFSANVDSFIIAEGIETYDELRTAFRLGVHYGQGFFLGKPSPDPGGLTEYAADTINELLDRKKRSKYTFDISIYNMIVNPVTFPNDTLTCGELDSLFRKNKSIDHIVILEAGIPKAVLTRAYFYSVFGGRFGYSVFEKKYAESIAKSNILLINENTDMRTAGRLAMSRRQEDLYDPVLVVDDEGNFVGTITMKQVINKAFDLEIKIATCSNPLTQLPGNIIIGYWLEEILRNNTFTVLYCDLDNFKEYNDRYGFSKGDDVLKATARILSDFTQEIPGAKLGHIGGDDFIIISESTINEEKIEELCLAFDKRRSDFFSLNHLEDGFYLATSRQGEKKSIPLIALSVAAVTDSNFTNPPHPGQLGQVSAMLKKRVKAQNKESGYSGYLFDRREYQIKESAVKN